MRILHKLGKKAFVLVSGFIPSDRPHLTNGGGEIDAFAGRNSVVRKTPLSPPSLLLFLFFSFQLNVVFITFFWLLYVDDGGVLTEGGVVLLVLMAASQEGR